MPELPEVETTVNYLRKKVLKRAFIDVWTDFAKIVKKPASFAEFKKQIKNLKIRQITRRGKNIIFDLFGNKSLLVHQKMTGHLLIGRWHLAAGSWQPHGEGPLEDSVNRFIHLMFWLDDGRMLGLSDLRKFAKVELWDKKALENSDVLKNLGPDPLRKDFTAEKLKLILRGKKGKIKKVLMDQSVIAGIGNIYSDEILWETKINPLRDVEILKDSEIEKIFVATQKILKKSIKLRGDSMSDYRLPSGERGGYQKIHKVYQREGKPCQRCKTKIKRIKINGRSGHYCPRCQK